MDKHAIRISVIATIYQEEQSILRLLSSLAAQQRQPDEVVFCDGGSTDQTLALIEHFRAEDPHALPHLQVLVEPGVNISRGRNLAIAAATGNIIAATDAGVQLTPTWLAELVAPWEQAAANNAEMPLGVAGFFAPDIRRNRATERIFLAAMAATVLPLRADIDPEKFLPSSRSVAFTKQAWQRAGGYPEWLDYCEDLIFDFTINAQQPDQPTAFAWAPDALVYFQPRPSLGSFWTQYYRYARGDGKADLWRKRHAIRYVTYLVAFPALVGHALWGFFAQWLGWLGLVAGIVLYCARPWQRLGELSPRLSWWERLLAALWVPVIRAVGDIAKMVGYPVGLWWRWQRRGDSQLDWRRDL